MLTTNLQPDDIYILRPDIFLRGAEDRIHIKYAGDNYIVRLQPECIRNIYRFCDLLDGERSLGAAMEDIPSAHRSYILKFLQFLVSKSAALRIESPLAESQLAPAQDALLYLRSFVDDSAAAFRCFLDARILLAAGDYALTSAIKTFACLGARRLSVLQLGDAWQANELQAVFAGLARWPDAALDVVTTPGPGYDCVVQCADGPAYPFEHLMAALPGAQHLVALVAHGQLCALHGADLPLLAPRHAGTPVTPPEGLCAGATAAMICFDHLCGVRLLPTGRYLHFGLDADVPMNSAGLYPLRPFAEGRPGADDAIVVAARAEELLRTPLSPLRSPVEHTPDGSSIKLYTCEAWLAGRDTPVTLASAGMTRTQCLAEALVQLADIHGHWFCNTAPAERAAIGRYLAQLDTARRAVAPLRAAPPAWRDAPALSAREQYLNFCINAAYGTRVRWADVPLATAAWPRCAVLCAGGATIYLPHDGDTSAAQREAGLLALYRALWQVEQAPARDIILPAQPIDAAQPTEAS
ncbi:hypothetical protein [Pseudoduganella buxea]|uniref:Uncharacterized protein n=1 Tax=Pseudoduganella buxea TaxID=1949069 RepID=A0A6I3SWN0_9BURK|nr:hypothetical protein [Pseudoduganella buxea]MTV53444.1 hypothetical protein [Pseudoduganella buxea]GGB95057.1 hypothetical protein GCM10011572_16270 [Pseudoduganella buxea]